MKLLTVVVGTCVPFEIVIRTLEQEVCRAGSLPRFLRNTRNKAKSASPSAALLNTCLYCRIFYRSTLPWLQHILANIWIKEFQVSHQNTTPMVAIFLHLPLYPLQPNPYNPSNMARASQARAITVRKQTYKTEGVGGVGKQNGRRAVEVGGSKNQYPRGC